MTKKQTIKEQALAAGIAPSVVYQRMKNGWTLQRALNTPVRERKPKQDDAATDLSAYYQHLYGELESMQREIIVGARRCKLVSLTAAAVILVLAWLAFGNGQL